MTLLSEDLRVSPTLAPFLQKLDEFSSESFKKQRATTISHIGNSFKRLGGGGTRDAFDIGDNKVLKIAFDVDFEAYQQNQNEWDISHCGGPKFLTKVYEHAENFNWIIAEKVDSITDQALSTLLSLKLGVKGVKRVDSNKFRLIIEQGLQKNFTSPPGKIYLELRKYNQWFLEFTDTLIKCNIEHSDFKFDNWGIRPSTGELVVLDYGFKRHN